MQIWLKKIDVGRPRKKGCNQGAQAAAAHGHGGTVHAARELENDEVAHGAAGQKLVPVRAPERAEVTCTMLEEVCSLTPGPAPAAAGPGQRTTRWGGSRWHCPRGSVANFAPRKQPHGLRVLFPEEPHFPRLQVPHVQQRAAPRRREEPLVCLERAAAVPPTLSVVDISGGGVWLSSGVNIKGAAARVLRISSHIRLFLLGRPLLLLWQCSASLLSLGRGHQLANDQAHWLSGKIGIRNLSFLEGDAPLDAALAKPCRFHVAWVGHSDHPAEHLEARGTDRQCKGVARVPWNRSEQCSLRQMTVAHDHGYCYLQTKDVSGAAFDGASDGGIRVVHTFVRED